MTHVLATAVVEPSAEPAPLSGFVESTFSPLAFEAGRRCLRAHPVDGARTAVVLASLMGDTTTADLASQRLVAGRVHNPLLFMQATANSVLGYLSREFGITGQQVSLSTLDDPMTEALAMAEVLLDEPELDRVRVIVVELAGTARVAAVHAELAGGEPGSAAPPAAPGAGDDLAAAVLLARGPGPSAPESLRSLLESAQATVGGNR
jgi:hypothetical protein